MSCNNFWRDPDHVRQCRAFRLRIPWAIWNNEVDHREAFPGDQGIRWKSHLGQEHPGLVADDERTGFNLDTQ